MLHKWAYFSKNAKGLTLLFAPKIDISEIGLLLQKRKGVNCHVLLPQLLAQQEYFGKDPTIL